MFDNVQSLSNQYFGDKGADLVVGIDIRDQSLPFMFEVFGDFDTSTNATGKSNGVFLPTKQFVLPINPEAYHMDLSTRTNITQTMSGAFQDNIGLGLPRFSIQGTFGYLGTLVPGHARSLDSNKKDAWQLFKDLEATFLDFYRRFGTYDEQGELVIKPIDPSNPPELRFYNYTDREFWTVQVDRFRLLRNTQRRFLYQYDIQMTGLKRVNAGMQEDELLSALQTINPIPIEELSLWERLLQAYSKTHEAITDIVNGIQALKEDISNLAQSINGFLTGAKAVIEAPFSLVTTAIEGIDSVISTAAGLADVPQEFIVSLRATKRNLLQLGFHQDKFRESSTATGTVSPAGDAESIPEIATVRIPNAMLNQGAAIDMDTPETTLFGTDMEATQDVPARIEPVLDNDTIESIAMRTLGNARAWKNLVMLNNLEYPYITKGMGRYSPITGTGTMMPAYSGDNVVMIPGQAPKAGTIIVINNDQESIVVDSYNSQTDTILLTAPLANDYPEGAPVTIHDRMLSVLVPGSTIKIPGKVDTSFVIPTEQEDFAVKLYGIDEYLDDNGDQHAASGDTETIAGIDNLVMQLKHRIMTTRGELAALGHPEYGSYLPQIVGKISTPVWLERAKLEAEIAMLQDPRVEKVENVTLVTMGTAVYIDANVRLIGQSNSQKVNIPLG